MTPRQFTVLLVSEDENLRSAVRHELETVDERRHVAAASSVDAARRMVEDFVPAVILLAEGPSVGPDEEFMAPAPRLHAAVTSLASYAPVVVIGAAEHQNELSGLVAAGIADYVVRTEQCLHIALGLVERRLRQAQTEAQSAAHFEECAPSYRGDPLAEFDGQDFGEVLRHELNNPLTGILGNAELLLSEIRRKSDGHLPQGAPQRLETITTLAVRLRETVRRLSQEWESRQHPVHSR